MLGCAGDIPTIEVLAAVSLLMLILVTLAYQGRMRLITVQLGAVDLNAVADARSLEPVLQPLFVGIVLLLAVSLGSLRLLRIKNRLDFYR